jgi:hypothetical protein
MNDIDKKLDEILGALVNQVEWCVNPAAGAVSVNREKEQAAQSTSKQLILNYILIDIIGNNEIVTGHNTNAYSDDDCDALVRNQLKAEQRAKLGVSE